MPFSATVHQSLTTQTAFSAKNGNIQAKAQYAFGGKLGFGYAEGGIGGTTKVLNRNEVVPDVPLCRK